MSKSSVGEAEKGDVVLPDQKLVSSEGDPIAMMDTRDVGTTVVIKEKPFTLISAAALGFQITNTATGVLLTVSYTLFGAGPLFFYGTIFIALVSFCVAISLGELASAFPHAGGQYYWVAQLAPEKHKRFFSYLTAVISWSSVVCIGSSAASALVNLTWELVAIRYPDFVYEQWMSFLVYQAWNLVAFFFNIFECTLAVQSKFFFMVAMIVLVSWFTALFASPTQKQTATAVFGADGYYNTTGWPAGVAFLVGIAGINWNFSCLDSVTHISEEIPQPHRNVPKALLVTVCIGLVTGLMMLLAVYFAAIDLPNTTSCIALLYSIYNGNANLTYGLGTLVLLSGFGALVGMHTWQARIAWSLSRDKGFPFHNQLSKLAPSPYNSPIMAHIWSTMWIAICGLLYLASVVAFNSFVAAGIILQYATYSFPVALLLIKGRKNFEHGPFWFPKLGFFSNIVLITWTCITLVFYCLPYYLPVDAGEMNYLSVVLVIAAIYAVSYWMLYGRKNFRLVNVSVIFD